MSASMKDRLIRKFEDEIQALDRELKIELPKEIKRARELGDLRENAEYSAAKERQRLVESQISLLKKRVAENLAEPGQAGDAVGWNEKRIAGCCHNNSGTATNGGSGHAGHARDRHHAHAVGSGAGGRRACSCTGSRPIRPA